jgi:hypothetical protein
MEENISLIDCLLICVKNRLFGSVNNRTNLCTNSIFEQLIYVRCENPIPSARTIIKRPSW